MMSRGTNKEWGMGQSTGHAVGYIRVSTDAHNRPLGAPLRHPLFLRDQIVAHLRHMYPV